jgi:multidrug transporter EmrE-like cation transporter
MQATLFEFRNLWWIFFALFSVTFFLYALDHVNFGIALTDWVAAGLFSSVARR